jgi:galactokinase
MTSDSLAERGAETFAKCFGQAPRWAVAAPGRVNLIGEHTDYNDGFVLPMAIERYTVMVADRTNDRHVTVHSITTGESAELNVRSPVQRGDPPWSNYVRGVIAGFQRRGIKVPGFNAVIDSTVPFGGGVSSSAALEVAAATLLETIHGQPLDPIEKALLCQKAEHEFAGVPCGIMDQFTSILARPNHALLLDCRSRETTWVPMNDPTVTVLIINTNVRHQLADGEYAKRRAECEAAARALGITSLRDATLKLLNAARARMEPISFRRARHVVTENERTVETAKAIRASDWPTVGKLMYASHKSLREDYEVSCGELDAVVEIASGLGPSKGAIGCRMTGAGFGGCAVCLVKSDAVQQVTRQMNDAYESQTGNQATIFSSRPAGGAEVLS